MKSTFTISFIFAFIFQATIAKDISVASQNVPGLLKDVQESNSSSGEINSTLPAAEAGTPNKFNVSEHVLLLHYYLKEEKLPEFFVNVTSNPKTITHLNITTEDIARLTKLNTLTLGQLDHLLANFSVTSTRAYTIDNLEIILNITGLPFFNFYTDLVRELRLDQATVSQILKDLSIDETKFSSYIVFGNVFEVLRNGSYEAQNVEKAVATSGSSLPIIFGHARDIVLKAAYQKQPEYYIKLFETFGFDKYQYEKLWKAQNITTIDVYNVEKFRVLLEDFMKRLNQDPRLGVVTNQYSVTVSKGIYNLFAEFQYVLKITACSLGNPECDEFKEVSTINAPERSQFIELKTSEKFSSYVNAAKDLSKSLENCTYVALSNNILLVANVTSIIANETHLVVSFNSTPDFTLGSPLVCNNQLYGLSKAYNQTEVVFDALYRQSSSASAFSVSISVFLTLIIFIII